MTSERLKVYAGTSNEYNVIESSSSGGVTGFNEGVPFKILYFRSLVNVILSTLGR